MNFLRRNHQPRNNSTYYENNGQTGTTGSSMPMKSTKHDDRRLRKSEKRQKQKKALFDINSGNFNRRPSFGQWLKFTWLDLLTMAAMGAVGLGVYNADPAPSRSFPINFSDGEIVYPEFAYPLRTEIIPIWEAALLASLIPIAVILLMQIRIRSFWDVNNAIIGLLYSLITAAVFQVFIKWLIGGLRPHFLYVCAPDLSRAFVNGQPQGQGFGNIMFQRDICTGDRNEINDSLESMPSGHSTAAWAGFLYLYFYLNAKLKVWSNYHPAMWKLLATYAPVLGAFLITGTLTIDEFHNWYDCLAGAVIGSVMALSAYRMTYASVFDFRFNHIPLTRHTPFSFGAGQAGAGGFEAAVFTRKAGWGYEEAYGGAPFDAATHLRGMQTGFNNEVHNNEHGHGHGGIGHGHSNSRTGRSRINERDNIDPNTGAVYNDGRHSNHHHRDGDVEYNAATTLPGNHMTGNHIAGNHTTGSHMPMTGNHMTGNHMTGSNMMGDNTTGNYTTGNHMTGNHMSGNHMTGNQTTGNYMPGNHMTDPNDNRYKVHSRSLERKAINRNSQGHML